MKKYISPTGTIVVVENNSIIEQYLLHNGNKINSRLSVILPLKLNSPKCIFGTLDNMIRICKLKSVS